jgi:hypothetical protein
MSKALLYDATMCIGCKQCKQACAQHNKLPYDDTVAAESVQSEHKYTVVLTKDDKFMRRSKGNRPARTVQVASKSVVAAIFWQLNGIERRLFRCAAAATKLSTTLRWRSQQISAHGCSVSRRRGK